MSALDMAPAVEGVAAFLAPLSPAVRETSIRGYARDFADHARSEKPDMDMGEHAGAFDAFEDALRRRLAELDGTPS